MKTLALCITICYNTSRKNINMNPLLVRDAAFILGVSPERVFGLAFEYEEEPRPKKYIADAFLTWYHDNKLNPIVEDFVLDVLAGRVQPKRK